MPESAYPDDEKKRKVVVVVVVVVVMTAIDGLRSTSRACWAGA